MPKERSKTLLKVLDTIAENHPVRALQVFSHRESGATITLYACAGKSFLVYEYGQSDGWDISIPITDSNSVAKTLAATLAYLGEKPRCAGCGEYWPCSDSARTDLTGIERAKHHL